MMILMIIVMMKIAMLMMKIMVDNNDDDKCFVLIIAVISDYSFYNMLSLPFIISKKAFANAVEKAIEKNFPHFHIRVSEA